MNSPVLALAAMPGNIESMTDDELVALCEEPEFLVTCTPMEVELLVRLGAALETHQQDLDYLEAEVTRLAAYEPTEIKEARHKAARQSLLALIAEVEAMPKAHVRVAD